MENGKLPIVHSWKEHDGALEADWMPAIAKYHKTALLKLWTSTRCPYRHAKAAACSPAPKRNHIGNVCNFAGPLLDKSSIPWQFNPILGIHNARHLNRQPCKDLT